MYVEGGTTTLTLTHIKRNIATSSKDMMLRNIAPTGANIQPAGGLLYYALPGPPGH